jgi:hypothetical protein
MRHHKPRGPKREVCRRLLISGQQRLARVLSADGSDWLLGWKW